MSNSASKRILSLDCPGIGWVRVYDHEHRGGETGRYSIQKCRIGHGITYAYRDQRPAALHHARQWLTTLRDAAPNAPEIIETS